VGGHDYWYRNGAPLTVEAAFAANVEKHDTMQVALMANKGGEKISPL